MSGANEISVGTANKSTISRQAATWFAKTMEGSISPGELLELREWLSADKQHEQAYAVIERMWTSSGEALEVHSGASPDRRQFMRRSMGFFAAAATGFAGWQAIKTRPDYATGTGERRTIDLPDGSVVELAARTEVTIAYSQTTRRVELDGEAFFRVVEDSTRPFIVEADGLSARALGTAFSVSSRPELTSVIVAEHAVEVLAGGQQVRVENGQSVRLIRGTLSQPASTDVETQLAWRRGQLIFMSRPLGDVIAVLNRWRKGRMIIMDDDLAREMVTLIMDVSNPGRIDRVLEEGLPVRLDNYSPWLTVVSRA